MFAPTIKLLVSGVDYWFFLLASELVKIAFKPILYFSHNLKFSMSYCFFDKEMRCWLCL